MNEKKMINKKPIIQAPNMFCCPDYIASRFWLIQFAISELSETTNLPSTRVMGEGEKELFQLPITFEERLGLK